MNKKLITNIPDLKMSSADLFYDPGVLAMALLDLLSAHEMGQLKWVTSGYMYEYLKNIKFDVQPLY